MRLEDFSDKKKKKRNGAPEQLQSIPHHPLALMRLADQLHLIRRMTARCRGAVRSVGFPRGRNGNEIRAEDVM